MNFTKHLKNNYHQPFSNAAKTGPDLGAHASNPSTSGSKGRWTARAQEFETSLSNMVKPHLYQKHKNYLGMVAHACGPSYLQ